MSTSTSSNRRDISMSETTKDRSIPLRSLSPSRLSRLRSGRSASPSSRQLLRSASKANRTPSSIWADEKMSTFRLSKRSTDEKSREDSSECLTIDDVAFEYFIKSKEDVFNLSNLSAATNLTLRASSLKEGEDGGKSNDEERSMPAQVAAPPAKEAKLQRLRRACGEFVDSAPVQIIMSILIVTNAVQLGALTFDLDKNVSGILEKTDLAILSAFTVEVTLHFVYLGLGLLKDGWLMFDAIVVLFSWAFMGSSLAILRSFRIFRIFSLVSRFESLRSLFEAVGSTIPKMASIWVALMIVFYIFCVLYTTLYSSLYDDGYLEHDYFGSLPKSFVTLFQVMTLDNWSDVARQVMTHNPASFIGFFAFIVFTAFFVVNLVVAVICETLIHINRAEEIKSGLTQNVNEQTDILLREVLKSQIKMQLSIQELTEQLKKQGLKEA